MSDVIHFDEQNKYDNYNFWSVGPTGAPVPEIIKMFEFLASNNYKVIFDGEEPELYRLDGQIVHKSYRPEIIQTIIDYLKKSVIEVAGMIDKARSSIHFKFNQHDILEKITKYGFGKILSDANLTYLPKFDIEMSRHSRYCAEFYFKNQFIQVQPDKCLSKDYKVLKSYISADEVIDFDITHIDINSPDEQAKAPRGKAFYNFLARTAGYIDETNAVIPTQTEKFNHLLKLIGYLLHNYRQQGETDYCVIFCDDHAGGTGKGLILQALEQMTAVCKIDAKLTFTRFAPSNLTRFTRVKVYNDIDRHFDWKTVYNEITDGGRIEYKNGHEILLNYKDTYKVAITSNEIIRGNDASDLRRQLVYSITPFFSEKRKVRDFYGHSFFSEDWQKEDWNYFYNVMFYCVQQWMLHNYKPFTYSDAEYEERKIDAMYPIEFREYIEEVLAKVNGAFGSGTGWIKTGDFYNDFKHHPKYRDTPYVRKMHSTLFGRISKDYLKTLGYSVQANSNRTELHISKKQ